MAPRTRQPLPEILRGSTMARGHWRAGSSRLGASGGTSLPWFLADENLAERASQRFRSVDDDKGEQENSVY